MLGLREVGAVTMSVGLLLVLTGCGLGSQTAAERACAQTVIGDWTDGTIDGVYPDECYLAAIDALPEDLRAYTSAGDDIVRALQSSRGSASTRAETSRTLAESSMNETAAVAPSLDRPPTTLLALVALVGVVISAGIGGYVARRLRRGPS